MKNNLTYEVIIIGGSYSGLAAAMALGRAGRTVLVIDAQEPYNRQTPYSHNFLTQDGIPPHEIAALGKEQVKKYTTVTFLNDRAEKATKTEKGFLIQTQSGLSIGAQKIILATGIRDIIPKIEGFQACWGTSALHCPYCHGYEVKGLPTGILGNSEAGFELAKLISNWTDNLTLFTNGKSTLSAEQTTLLKLHHIEVDERIIQKLLHNSGYLEGIEFQDHSHRAIKALYVKPKFTLHNSITTDLGCALTEEGYIQVDAQQKTSVPGIYASGDSTSRMRTVANAIATGTTAGMMLNKEWVEEQFNLKK